VALPRPEEAEQQAAQETTAEILQAMDVNLP
jgi:hypothetical protein